MIQWVQIAEIKMLFSRCLIKVGKCELYVFFLLSNVMIVPSLKKSA